MKLHCKTNYVLTLVLFTENCPVEFETEHTHTHTHTQRENTHLISFSLLNEVYFSDTIADICSVFKHKLN